MPDTNDEMPLQVGRWAVEMAKMPPLQRHIAEALADTCDQWYTPHAGRYMPDVREISRIAAAAIETPRTSRPDEP